MTTSSSLCLSPTVLKDAAGVAGNIFAFGLFLSPIPTFRRIMRNRSTEQFSGMPYIYALLNCLICLWYGSPIVSPDNLLVFSVNSVGAVFQLIYSVIFMIHADKARKVKMLVTLLIVFAIWAVIVVGSLQIPYHNVRQDLVGLLSGASLISMFASPLFIINLVIRTKSVEFMPFYLSLSTFFMSVSFFTYGIFNDDAFVFVPNGIGTLLGMLQLALYSYYRKGSVADKDESQEPLIVSYS